MASWSVCRVWRGGDDEFSVVDDAAEDVIKNRSNWYWVAL